MAGTTKQRGIENIRLTVAEAVTPESDEISQHIMIHKAMLEQRVKDDTEWTAVTRNAHSELYLRHCAKLLDDYLRQYGTPMYLRRVFCLRVNGN